MNLGYAARRVDVILNADDFGLADGVCAAIVELLQRGGLTSTSAMVCSPGAPDRVARWAGRVRGSTGAHLQLTGGTPVLGAGEVPSLVQEDGRFPSQRGQIKTPHPDQIRREWRAQLALLRELGVRPTHLDTHHHVHHLPEVFPVFCQIAREYALPARAVDAGMARRLRAAGIVCPDAFAVTGCDGDLSIARLVGTVRAAADGVAGCTSVELMCLPGFADAELSRVSRYVGDRERAFDVLSDPALFQALEKCGFVRVVHGLVNA